MVTNSRVNLMKTFHYYLQILSIQSQMEEIKLVYHRMKDYGLVPPTSLYNQLLTDFGKVFFLISSEFSFTFTLN